MKSLTVGYRLNIATIYLQFGKARITNDLQDSELTHVIVDPEQPRLRVIRADLAR